jgi:hypothetical protein
LSSLPSRARAFPPQLPLDFSQRVRRTDPETSKVAALRAGEFAAAHHAKIVGSLVTQGAATIYELAERVGIDHVAVARRMAELERLTVARPKVEDGKPVTRPGPKGRGCRVWEAC